MTRFARHTIRRWFNLLVLAGLWCSHLRADSIAQVSTSTSTLYDLGSITASCSNPGTWITSGLNTANCSSTDGFSNVTANAYVNPDGSIVTNITALSAGPSPVAYGTSAESYGAVEGSLVLNPAVRFLAFNESVTGAADVNCSGDICDFSVAYMMHIIFDYQPLVIVDGNGGGSQRNINLGGSQMYVVPVTNSATHQLVVNEYIRTHCDVFDYSFDSSSYVCGYTAEMIDPLSIQGLDANMQVVPDAIVESTLGYNYPPVAPVPEPTTFLLIGAGGLAGALKRQMGV